MSDASEGDGSGNDFDDLMPPPPPLVSGISDMLFPKPKNSVTRKPVGRAHIKRSRPSTVEGAHNM